MGQDTGGCYDVVWGPVEVLYCNRSPGGAKVLASPTHLFTTQWWLCSGTLQRAQDGHNTPLPISVRRGKRGGGRGEEEGEEEEGEGRRERGGGGRGGGGEGRREIMACLSCRPWLHLAVV